MSPTQTKAPKPADKSATQPAEKRQDRTPALGWHIGADLAKAWSAP